MTDEHGLPVPNKSTPLPWSESIRIYGRGIEWVTSHDAFNHKSNRDFTVHAANWIIPCREIVRRLAECHPSDWDMVATDAAKLWAEMQRKSKRGRG